MADAKYICDSFDQWLKVATKGLAKSSQEIVLKEIDAHALEAYESALRDGMGRDEAGLFAVKSLGDPKEANRDYRAELLTKSEAFHLGRMNKFSTGKINFFFSFFLIFAGLVCLVEFGDVGERFYPANLILLTFVFMGVFNLAILIPQPSRWMILTYRIGTISVMLPIVYLIAQELISFESSIMVCFVIGVCILLGLRVVVLNVALRRKLPKADWPNMLHWN